MNNITSVVSGLIPYMFTTIAFIIAAKRDSGEIDSLRKKCQELAEQRTRALVRETAVIHLNVELKNEVARLKRDADQFSEARTVFRPSVAEASTRQHDNDNDTALVVAYGAPPAPIDHYIPEAVESMQRTLLGVTRTKVSIPGPKKSKLPRR